MVAVLNGELALLRVLNLAEFAARVFGKLLGGGAGVLGSLFNHGRLDLVEFRKLVLHLLVVVVGRNGNTLLQEFAHAQHQLVGKLNFVGGDGGDAGHVVAGAVEIVGITVGLQINDARCTGRNLLFLDAVAL